MNQPLDANRNGPGGRGPAFSLGNRVFRVFWMTAWLVLCRFTPPPLHGWRRLVLILFGARIGPGAILYDQGNISIGEGSVISQRAHVCASSHDLRDPNFQLVLRPVTIAADCWVAAEAFVGPGVTMAEGSVLAARGALFDDAEAWTIYRGNPASAIKQRAMRGR